MQRRAIALLICFLSAGATKSQDRLSAYKTDLDTATTKPAGSTERADAIRNLLNLQHHPQKFVSFAYPDVLFDMALGFWDQSRVDKQIGATATGSGATDLVSLPSTPELFGFAMNVGALTQTVSGTAVTFRGNADGILRGIAGQPISCNGCVGTHGLKNLSFAASFDLSRQGTQTVSTSGAGNSATTMVPATVLLPKSARQFTVFSARYDIYNPKDTRSSDFQNKWSDWFSAHQSDLEAAGTELLAAVSNFLDPVLTDPKYADLRGEYFTKLNQARAEDVPTLFSAFLSKALQLARADVPNFDQQVLSVRAAYAKYGATYEDKFQELRGKPQFSFEYTFSSLVGQPDTHNFRFIFASNPFGGGGLFSTNVAVTLYGGQFPAGAKYGRVRDFQFAAQFDRPIGSINSYPAVFTLAGYVQYQLDPAVLNLGPGNLVPGTTITLPADAQVLLGKKGTLGIAQAKITLKMKNSGVKIPIAVSWANRTELLNATDVRGHVGITYDLDALFGHH